jgi:F-type H+-transporting ATPase subunit b
VEEHGNGMVELLRASRPWVNFAIYAWFMKRTLTGPVHEFFRARAERLREELAAGDRARREAEQLRAELARELADLPATQERLKADLLATASQRRGELLAQGEQAAVRIRSDAGMLAEQEVATAGRTLREEMVGDVVRAATALVRQAIGPQDHERFVREFVETAGASA